MKRLDNIAAALVSDIGFRRKVDRLHGSAVGGGEGVMTDQHSTILTFDSTEVAADVNETALKALQDYDHGIAAPVLELVP